MGWTEVETLVCVLDDGTVHVFDIRGEPVTTFNMGQVW